MIIYIKLRIILFLLHIYIWLFNECYLIYYILYQYSDTYVSMYTVPHFLLLNYTFLRKGEILRYLFTFQKKEKLSLRLGCTSIHIIRDSVIRACTRTY